MKRLKITYDSFRLLSFAILIPTLIITILPFILIISASFTNEDILVRYGYSLLPKRFSLDAYIFLLSQWDIIGRAYGISIFVTIIGTLINTIISAGYAYAIYRKNNKYRKVLTFIVLFTLLFNGGIVPSYLMWTRFFHITDTIFALIVPNYLVNAINIFIIRNYFSSNIPEAVIEAAKIDGATELRVFRVIILPMSLPVLITVGIMTGLTYWNDWLNALYYINNPKLYGIQNLLIRLINNITFLQSSQASTLLGANVVKLPSTALRMAMAVIGILPILIALPFLLKFITKGMVMGAIKG